MSQLPFANGWGEWLCSDHFVWSGSAVAKLRVRSLGGLGGLLLRLSLVPICRYSSQQEGPPHPLLGGEGGVPSRTCTLVYGTPSVDSEPQHSCPSGHQSLHRSLGQVRPLSVDCVVSVHTLGPQESPRAVQAGCPPAVHTACWLGKEAGGGRQPEFSLHLHVLKWGPDPKFKLGFPGRRVCEGRKIKHFRWFAGLILLRIYA